MVVLLEGSHMSTEELWSSVRMTIGFSLTKALHPRLIRLAGRSVLRRDLVVPNLFYLRMMEATVFLGTFNPASSELCFDTMMSKSSTDNTFNLIAWFLL